MTVELNRRKFLTAAGALSVPVLLSSCGFSKSGSSSGHRDAKSALLALCMAAAGADWASLTGPASACRTLQRLAMDARLQE